MQNTNTWNVPKLKLDMVIIIVFLLFFYAMILSDIFEYWSKFCRLPWRMKGFTVYGSKGDDWHMCKEGRGGGFQGGGLGLNARQ